MAQTENLRAFVKIVELGSISKAAEALNIAKSALSRRLSLLENRFQTRLIDRAPGVWKLTATGQELYQRAASAINELEEIEGDYTETSLGLSGSLSISIPREFGESRLSSLLMAFKQAYPSITMNVDFDDRQVDLEREDYDFIVRITSEKLTGANITKLGESRHCLYASKSYIQQQGKPQTLTALKQHALLHHGPARRALWIFKDMAGQERNLDFYPTLNSNNGSFLLQATLQGVGISRLPDFIIEKAKDRTEIEVILPEYTIAKWGIFLVHAPNRRINKKMRVFINFILSAYPLYS